MWKKGATVCRRVVCGPTSRPADAAPGRCAATVRQEVLRISCEIYDSDAELSSWHCDPHAHTRAHTLSLPSLIY